MTKEQLSPEWELIQKIVSQYGNAVAMPLFELWVKDYALMKAQPLVDALQKVVDWQFPETGKFWDKDQMEPMSYAAVYGINGERDYMRGIAKDALASYAGSAETWQPIATAPKDGTTIEVRYDKEHTDTCLAMWSQTPVYTLRNLNREYQPGWATAPESPYDTNLLLHSPTYWRPYAGSTEQAKKKVSRFEYAILQSVNPEKAKDFEPYTENEEMDARVSNLRAQASKLRIQAGSAEGEKEEFKGSNFVNPAPGISIGCITPEARNLLDTIMVTWDSHYKGLKEMHGEQYEPTYYGFAYWLTKWSGLIQPSNTEVSAKEPEKKDPWISVKDHPLVIDIKLGWECTEAGEGEFLAAIELDDDHWWIRHCVIEDVIGLCVVGADERVPAEWDVKDVQYYWPLPEPPAATNQEGGSHE